MPANLGRSRDGGKPRPGAPQAPTASWRMLHSKLAKISYDFPTKDMLGG
jgi:hypothetical protein